jgi:hypothetical protein
MSLIGETLLEAGSPQNSLEVTLSHELVVLLSEQLYQSPLKAIEELVVNSFDADAKTCRVNIPDDLEGADAQPIAVFDDGVGMDEAGLADLWHVGHSSKRDEVIERQRKRTQIGKFGIGKLATYAIARRITYVTKGKNEPVLVTSLDFNAFHEDPTGGSEAIELPVRELTPSQLKAETDLLRTLEAAKVKTGKLTNKNASWTVVLLENFKDKVIQLRLGHLRWVLSTAMPLKSDFRLYLNGEEIKSSKESFEQVVSFGVHELAADRIKQLSERTDRTWKVKGNKLVSPDFPTGVRGEVIVTRRSLVTGKSEDIARSHGFFIRVRDRLVNIEDALFGLKPASHATFNRFRADIDADDLDQDLTAPREGVATTSDLRKQFEILLSELYLQARSRYQEWVKNSESKDKKDKEHQRNWVNPALVERPVADALSGGAGEPDDDLLDGADADESWFYLQIPDSAKIEDLLPELYGDSRSKSYIYENTQMGPAGRLVSFSPEEGVFRINEDHELVRAHDEDAQSLLEDFVTAEALLEVYLRAENMPAAQVGEVLERRDQLLRSLARDRVYSVKAIAAELRDAKNDKYDLEVALVTASRAVGFVAKHISGSKEPDGIARFIDAMGEQKITLEAKSSKDIPSLNDIDFAGLVSHRTAWKAAGCLLVAPKYPGGTRKEKAEAAVRAKEGKVSCWTVEQLAQIVECSEDRHIGARDVLQITQEKFSPEEVADAVEELLSAPNWDQRALYLAILDALDSLQGRLPGDPRTIDQVATEISRDVEAFQDLDTDQIRRAVGQLAGSSKGILLLRENRLILNGSLEELRNRTRGLTGTRGVGRRNGTFHEDGT